MGDPDRARFDVWASQWGGEMGLHHLDFDGLWLAWQEAARQEREAIAVLIDDEMIITDPSDRAEAAAAIRARSEQGSKR